MSHPIITEVTLNASPERIWQALTNTEQMKSWYFDMNGFETVEGNSFFFYEPGANKKFKHQCQVTAVVPNQKLQHTWAYPELTTGSSVVTWEIFPDGDQTRVVNTHEGIETFSDGGKDFARESFEAGWKEILNIFLKEFVEK